jgi:hypothetical protein
MKNQTFLKVVLCCSVVVLATLTVQVQGQPPQGRGRGAYGDWLVKVDYDGRQFESILTFSRDQEGNRTAQWISFWGITELKDVSFEDGKLSFAMERRNREGQMSTTKFTGTIEEGKLTGTMSSDTGERKVEGARMPRMPRAVGNWQMKVKMEDRERESTIAIKVDKEGKLSGQWSSDRGTPIQISEVQYERGNVSFTMEGKREDREWKMSFKGTIDRESDTLTGTFTSNRGEIQAEGKRIGSALIGDWKLEMESERGPREQRLRVNPDMTGLYGALPIKKINFEDGKVDFLLVMQFGDQTFEMTFAGKLEDSKLTGELTSSRGSQKIKGTKIVRTYRRRSSQ